MGWRFQRVLRIIPGLRINLSKSGVSTSVGPKGASVNVGRHGVTTSAGIPGTGLSYRQRLGHPGTWLGIVLLVAGLAWAYRDPIGAMLNPSAVPAPGATTTIAAPAAGEVAASGIRYVRRGNTNLREAPANSARTIRKEAKGTQVMLIAVSGPWSKVQDGTVIGWLRSSVLGETPPKTR